MSEKMCGALFNILGDIEDLTVLDAFAGSGALSFEAISRNARHVTAIESDHTAHQVITHNIKKLAVEAFITLVYAANTQWMQANQDASFDIVVCDPPYDNLQSGTIGMLATHVKKEGLLVLSWPGNSIPLVIPGLEQIDMRTYGDAQLIFYRA
jgi:16S rRNA (guanine966-N2)-methyltransferase